MMDQAHIQHVPSVLVTIAANLLMEQALAPRFTFIPKMRESDPQEGFDYGEQSYDQAKGKPGTDHSLF